MEVEDYITWGTFAAIPAVGAASALFSAKVISKYGHQFIHFGPTNKLLIGCIGAIHTLAVLSLLAYRDKDEYREKIGVILEERVICHLIVGGILYGLTKLAARVHLITNGLTLHGATLMVVTSLVSSFLVEKATHVLYQWFDDDD